MRTRSFAIQPNGSLVPAATRCIGLRDGALAYDGPATAAKIRELVGGE